MKIIWPICFGLGLLILTGCQPDTAQSTDKHQSSATSNIDAKRQKEIDAIEDNINNSYARLASKRDDVCPKLIQQSIGSSQVSRSAEVMTADYCDYYLYPQSGQTLNVTVNDSRLEALLVVPIFHDFDNGSYHVTSYDKHVIRISYNGATYKPERLSYDVTISVTD